MATEHVLLSGLTAAEETELRDYRMKSRDDNPEVLTSDEWRRFTSLQTKEFRANQMANDEEIARLTEARDSERISRRRERISEVPFIPRHESSRRMDFEEHYDPQEDRAMNKILDLTSDELDKMDISEAKNLLGKLPHEQTAIMKLAAKIVFHEKDTLKTVKRSNDTIEAPITGDVNELTMSNIKQIRATFGEAKYGSTTQKNITMVELLRRAKTLTLSLKLNTKTSIEMLKMVATGSFYETLLRFDDQAYPLPVIYQILQSSYQDSISVNQARQTLERIMSKTNADTNVYLLMTDLIKCNFQVFQYSPKEVRTAESLNHSISKVFEFLFANFDKQAIDELWDKWNMFRADSNSVLTELEVWNFMPTIEYHLAYKAKPLVGRKSSEGQRDRPEVQKHSTRIIPHKVNDIEDGARGPPYLEEEEQYEPEEVSDVEAWRGPAQTGAKRDFSKGGNPSGGLPDAVETKWTPRPMGARPQPQPPTAQNWRNSPREEGTGNRPYSQNRQEGYIPKELSTNPADYRPDCYCLNCGGSSQVHAPPYWQQCPLYPNQRPCGITCKGCGFQNKIVNEKCNNPLLTLIKRRTQVVSELRENQQDAAQSSCQRRTENLHTDAEEFWTPDDPGRLTTSWRT